MGQPEKKKTALSWSDLPEELLPFISRGLKTRIDTLHFRAVCHSWRSSISLQQKSSPLPLRLQFQIYNLVNPLGSFLISQTTIYHIEPDHETLKTSPNNKGWLIKVQETKDEGKMIALDPFSTLPIEDLPDSFPRVLNLLNLHVSEVSRAFKLQMAKHDDDDVEEEVARAYKVELSSNFESNKKVVAIREGKLCCMKVGYQQEWIPLDENVVYRDIVNHRGIFYAVDRFGLVVWSRDEPSLFIDNFVVDHSSPVMTWAFPSPKRFYGDWYFIKSCGDLFLVGRDLKICGDKVYYNRYFHAFVKEDNDFDIPVVFKVYTLSNVGNWTNKWREVNNLGDRAFFVSYHCSFSVLARDFAGCKANCIYFVDEIKYDGDGDDDEDDDDSDDDLKGLDDTKVCMYNLENGSSGPLTSYPGCSNPFWPPPAWLSSKLYSSSC